MVKKTIPQLQEATSVTDNAYFVFDTGSVTKKIKMINLQKSFKLKTRTIVVTAQSILSDDDTVLFNTPDTAVVMTTTLPAPADVTGRPIRIKNIGPGLLTINTSNPGVIKIDGANTLDLNIQYQSVTLVSDGTNYFIF